MIVLTAWVGASACGCVNHDDRLNGGNDRIAAPLGTISIYQLAGRLDLSVDENSSTMATLTSPDNVVVIYSDPSGAAYVNGSAVIGTGPIWPVGDMLFVSESMESDIGSLLVKRTIAEPLGRIEPLPSDVPSHPNRSCIVIDAGHGGKDPGALSVIGIQEKDVVLDAAMAVAGSLRAGGQKAVMTRSDDTFVELNERANIANRVGARAFVSIHADSCHNPSADGYTIYVARSASSGSLALASAIERQLASTGAASRGVRRANYRVLVRTTCPAVLVELGYLSNVYEARRLSQSGYRRGLAKAITEGIIEYCRETGR